MCIPHQEIFLSIIHFLFSRNVMLLFCKFRGLFLSYLKHSLTHFKLHMDRNDLSKREGTQAFLTTICHLNIIHTKDMTTSIVKHVVLSYYVKFYTPQCDCIEIIGASFKAKDYRFTSITILNIIHTKNMSYNFVKLSPCISDYISECTKYKHVI